MMRDCRFEPAVVDAVSRFEWPPRADAGLRAHVGGCAVCREVAEVALLLRSDRGEPLTGVRIPPAERVWWRAQLRARLEDAELSARPVNLMHAAAAAAAGGLAVAGVTFAWPRLPWPDFRAWTDWLPALQAAGAQALGGTAVVPHLLLFALVVAAAGLLLAPLALYFVLSE